MSYQLHGSLPIIWPKIAELSIMYLFYMCFRGQHDFVVNKSKILTLKSTDKTFGLMIGKEVKNFPALSLLLFIGSQTQFIYYLLMNIYHHITILLLLICASQQITSAKTVSPNSRYIGTGLATIDTSSTFNNASASTWNPITYILSYPVTFGPVWQVLAVLSLNNLYADFSSNRISVLCKELVTTSGVILYLFSNFTSKIKTLRYRYLAIANNYWDTNNMGAYKVFYNISSNVSSATPQSLNFSLDTSLNLTGGVDIFITHLGLDFSTTDSNYVIDLQLSAAYINSTYIQINVTSKSSVPVFIYLLGVNWLAYNRGFYNQANYASFALQTTQGSSFTLTNTSQFYNDTTMVGLYSFSISNDSFYDFQNQYNSPNSFSISTSNRNATFSLSYLVLLTYYCSYTTPYYFASNSLCYDSCPARYYSQLYSLSCLSCAYDCYTCNSSGCLSCNGSQDHRILSSNRCVPMVGYYETYTTTAGQCRYDCFSCSSNDKCSSCDNQNQHRTMNYANLKCVPSQGYYESNISVAAKCRLDCATCNNPDSCSTCDSATQHRVLNSQTGKCDPVAGYYQTNLSACAACPAGCSTCESAQKCNSCISGYFLNSQYVCQSCSSGCAICNSSQTCTASSTNTTSNSTTSNTSNSTTNSTTNTNASTNSSSNTSINSSTSPSTNTVVSSSTSNSTVIGLVAGVSVAATLIIIGVAKLIHYLYNRPAAGACINAPGESSVIYLEGSQPPPILSQLQINPTIAVTDSLIPDKVGIWHERGRQTTVRQQCCICSQQFSFVKLDCKHFYHIKCIVTWSLEGSGCPMCRRDFKDKNHRLFCRLCRKKEKLVPFPDLLKSYQQRRYESEGICDQCRMIDA